MKKTKRPKIARVPTIIGATVLLVLLVCRITLPYIIKNIIEGKLSNKLGVQTTIGDLNLSLLKGSATMRNITINNPSGFVSEPCISVQKVFVDVSLTSLLSKEIRIELVDIQRLVFRIQRSKEGDFNFKPFLVHSKSNPSHSTEETPDTQFNKGIFLNLLTAEEVQISFEDYAVSELPLITELKDIAVSLKSFRYPGNSFDNESEMNINGQLMATKMSPLFIHSTFQLGKTPPGTIISDAQEKVEYIYLPHFNPYARRYGYIFKSGIVSITYTGKTAQGQIDGLGDIRFEKVQFVKADLRLSSLILGIPLQSLPQLFQDPNGTLELTLEVNGNIGNPQVSWSKLSEQLLIKTLGNAFKSGSILLRKPFDFIIESITHGEKEGNIFHKLKDMLNPQTSPKEEKKEFQEEQQEKLKDFFRIKLFDQLSKPKKKENEERKEE